MNYGVGAEINVTEKMFVGLELIGRQMQGYGYDGESSERQNHTISLRGGFRF
jgi:opacity protein-like surface antigen